MLPSCSLHLFEPRRFVGQPRHEYGLLQQLAYRHILMFPPYSSDDSFAQPVGQRRQTFRKAVCTTCATKPCQKGDARGDASLFEAKGCAK